MAVVHVKGHQRGINFLTRGNNLADHEAKRVALQVLLEKAENSETKSFSEKEMQKFESLGVTQ